jgi:hypothetical protein
MLEKNIENSVNGLKYRHPSELWLPFENWFTKLRMLFKAYFWIFLPFTISSVLFGVISFYFISSFVISNNVSRSYYLFHSESSQKFPIYFQNDYGVKNLERNGIIAVGNSKYFYLISENLTSEGKEIISKIYEENNSNVFCTRIIALLSVIFSLVIFCLEVHLFGKKLTAKFEKSGKKIKEDQHIRGSKIISITRFETMDENSDIPFDERISEIGTAGDLPLFNGTVVNPDNKDEKKDIKIFLPIENEVYHLLFLGTTGSGKTQSLFPMLKASIDRGTKNIVYDVKGDFTSLTFEPKRNMLFAPFDKRSFSWCPFADLNDDWDCREFAEVLIPDSPGENPYFIQAPRDILGSILIALRFLGQTTNNDLIHAIKSTREDLIDLLKETEASSASIQHIVNSDSAQTQGVLASLRTYCMSLEILERWPDASAENSFSFRNYITDSSLNSNLIIQSYPQREKILAPLLSTIYNVLFKAGLSLPDNSDLKNRVLFFFDELAQLNKMDSFVQLLTLARSKNIGIISAIQDFGLIRSKYQKDLLETILNNFNGLILGRMNETSVLKWIEYRLGKEEYIKHEESHSFGPTDFADKITSNRTRHEKNVVLGSEISTLENLEYFLVINSLITKGKRTYQKFKPIAEPFEMYSDEDLVAEWDLSE